MFTGMCLSTGVGAWSGGVPGPEGVCSTGGVGWRPPRRLLLRTVRILLEWNAFLLNVSVHAKVDQVASVNVLA